MKRAAPFGTALLVSVMKLSERTSGSDELDHQESAGDDSDDTRNGGALDDFDRGDHGDTGHENRHAGERGHRAAESAGQEGETAKTRDGHAEGFGVRGHSFVEGLGGSVAGTGDDAHDPRTEGAAPTGEFVGVLKGGDGGGNETRGAETGGENAGGSS